MKEFLIFFVSRQIGNQVAVVLAKAAFDAIDAVVNYGVEYNNTVVFPDKIIGVAIAN